MKTSKMTYATRLQPANTIDRGRAIITGGAGTASTEFADTDCRGRIHASRIVHAGKRPDLPDTSDTLKKAKRIPKPQTKPELGI